MSSLLGKLRVRMFMPGPEETRMEGKPGWRPTGAVQRAQLSTVADTFMTGLRVGLEGVPTSGIDARLGPIDPEFRGFAYEGCAMGLAVTDSVSVRPHRTREYFAGPGAPHVYMAYIGVGWAMARIPRMRWRAVIPRHSLYEWLAFDGFGFHQAFFATEKWVTQTWRPSGYPAWPGDRAYAGYAHNAVDQGIGRALWFVNGANPDAVTECIAAYDPSRHSDLWSGVGLASVYAGGVDVGALTRLGELAGRHRPAIAQGAVFAAKTRLMTGLVIPHTELAVKTHCELTVEDAAAIADRIEAELPPDGATPAYEVWRKRIQAEFR